MERTAIFTLFLLSYWIAACYAQDPAPGMIEEHGTKTLTYDSTGASDPISTKVWYKGYYNGSAGHQPEDKDTIYSYLSGQWYEGPVAKARSGDMSINGDDLVINPVQLADDGYFTCKTYYMKGGLLRTVYNRAAHLLVYVLPKKVEIKLAPVDIENGEKLVVTCTTDRLFPELPDNNFTMTWNGDKVCPGKSDCVYNPISSGIPDDLAKKYQLEYTQVVTQPDNRNDIQCIVEGYTGAQVKSVSVKLDVKYWINLLIATAVLVGFKH